jgi:NADP-dependent 3-hydroxy acid dehydrogenase YdfG
MTRLDERRVLVTGGSRGIGAAIVRSAAAAGARCAFIARDAHAADRCSRDTGALALLADLARPEEAADAVRQAVTALGGLDVLVNNAGTFRLGRVADGDYSDWRDMVDVNVLGLLTVCRSAIPHLVEGNNGQIINISSLSGRRVSDAVTGVYGGTKHAVHAISEGLRKELHGARIRVTVVAFGLVATNFGSYITDPDVRAGAREGQADLGLDARDAAAQVLHILAVPPDVHIAEIALMSVRQPPG